MWDNKPESIGQALITATKYLEGVGGTPRLDAELLLCHILRCDRVKLVANSRDQITDESLETFRLLLDRRARNEPVAYITGTREFWKHSFLVTPDVLIPRPETEFIVERGVEILKSSHLPKPITVDLGTGSGCIVCSLAAECKELGINARFIAVDISQKALDVAVVNAQRLGVDDIIEFRLGSWFEPLNDLKDSVDLLVTNPPYIANDDPRVGEECAFEPRVALYGGVVGTEALQIILDEFPNYASPVGKVLIEIGLDQGDFFSESNWDITIYRDLQGHTRTVELSP